MPERPHIRLRKSLLEPLPAARWPSGFGLIPLSAARPHTVHKLLVDAYANGFGDITEFDAWWTSLVEDAEFDPGLIFIAANAAGEPVGVAQCWTSAFVKDIAIAAGYRGKGLGEALLWTAFAAFKARGIAHVDLKVQTQNADAQRLYARVGMVKVPP
ncbi:MAG: GNAT family N-acetyltransferase [Devosia sp.]